MCVIKDHKDATLDEMFSHGAFKFVPFFFFPTPYASFVQIELYWGGFYRQKWLTQQAWDTEYGRIGREANMWWLGSMRAN